MLSGVEVRSLGYRTDLTARALEGSRVEDRGDYLVLRSPDNPGYWWGNFLLLPSLGPGEAADWLPPVAAGVPGGRPRERGAGEPADCLARCAAECPDARHVTLGVDVTDGARVAGDELAAAGFTAQRSVVLTADRLRPPPYPHGEATYR